MILRIFLRTCRCEPATKLTNVCTFMHSHSLHSHYHIVIFNESEAILQLVGEITQNKSNKCNQLNAFFLCFYLFRKCELRNASDPSSGFQLSICQSTCSGLLKFDKKCFDESDFTALKNLNYSETVLEIATWAFNFNCYDPSTYAVPKVPISNTSCDDMSFLDGVLSSTSAGELDIHVFAVYS